MRVAVILESELHIGGGFQHELSIAALLRQHEGAHQFVFYTTQKENQGLLKGRGIEARYLDVRYLNNSVRPRLTKRQLFYRLLRPMRLLQDPFEGVLLKDGIDLIYFLGSSSLALSVSRINYVMTVWDLCHRDHPEFPEVNFNGQFEEREHVYKNALQKAVAVLVDSDLGKGHVVERYGCDAGRVHVAKFLPSVGLEGNGRVDIKTKYSLSRPYIFYPAQFWAHKNHVYILDGLKVLRQKYGRETDVVFSGADKGNLQHVLAYARKLGLQDAVHYVGFVSNEDMTALYQQAVALVMPTYFGPTNIPPLEAFALGCPVCYSDLPGLREQVGDAGFLMDLDDPTSMAKHIMTVMDDPVAVQKKLQLGKEISAGWTEQDYWNVLEGILEKYARKMRCWKDI